MQTATFDQRGPRISSWLHSLAILPSSKHRSTNPFWEIKAKFCSRIQHYAIVCQFPANYYVSLNRCAKSMFCSLRWKRIGSDPLLNSTMHNLDMLYVCFECSNMLLGKACLGHHVSHCCKRDVPAKILYRAVTEQDPSTKMENPSKYKWILCNKCDHLDLLPTARSKTITAMSRWARCTAMLFARNQNSEEFPALQWWTFSVGLSPALLRTTWHMHDIKSHE